MEHDADPKDTTNNEIDEDEIPKIVKSDQGARTNYDYLFKVSLIGDSGTGKTSVLLRLTDNTFTENTSSTIGVDFKIVSVKYKKKQAKVQIWDTCGSERFKSLTTSFIKTCGVFVMIFDLSDKKSFESISYWLRLVLDNTSPKLLCLVGNKSDLIMDPGNEVIKKEEIYAFAEKYGMYYLETSAKNNNNIEAMFKVVCEGLFKEAMKNMKNKDSEKFSTGYKSIMTNPDEEDEKGKKLNIIKKGKTGCCKE
jgi:Ras-related protein Rab-1A